MAPTPVFLSGESHGRRSLVGYSPWDHKESDTAEQLHVCVHQLKYGITEAQHKSVTVKNWLPGGMDVRTRVRKNRVSRDNNDNVVYCSEVWTHLHPWPLGFTSDKTGVLQGLVQEITRP